MKATRWRRKRRPGDDEPVAPPPRFPLPASLFPRFPLPRFPLPSPLAPSSWPFALPSHLRAPATPPRLRPAAGAHLPIAATIDRCGETGSRCELPFAVQFRRCPRNGKQVKLGLCATARVRGKATGPASSDAACEPGDRPAAGDGFSHRPKLKALRRATVGHAGHDSRRRRPRTSVPPCHQPRVSVGGSQCSKS